MTDERDPSPIRTVLVEGIAHNLRELIPTPIVETDSRRIAAVLLDAITPRSLELLAERRVSDYRANQEAQTDNTRTILEQMRDQLLIVLINRDSGRVRVAVSEIEAAADSFLSMTVADSTFTFSVEKKN